jgi:vacuolar-type H+-ATPase subunit I/STV1
MVAEHTPSGISHTHGAMHEGLQFQAGRSLSPDLRNFIQRKLPGQHNTSYSHFIPECGSLIIGAVGLLLTQGRANPTIVGKFFGGLYGLYGITGYLGDTLSYSRLLALGLASGLIGWSFNLLIGLLGTGPVVYIAGPVIFIAGHLFNFFVGGLGTFVHTCRLQYLEFFGKFYEGGGKAFTPLTINTKFIKVKSE